MEDIFGRVASERNQPDAPGRLVNAPCSVAFIVWISCVVLGGFAGGSARASVLRVPADYATLQAAIDAAAPGDQVQVANGVYSGLGNTDLDFRGKAITLRSEGGPRECVIDCLASATRRHRAFYFHSGETADAVVEGITIKGGYADQHGGAMLFVGSGPTVRNCIITNNVALGPSYPNLQGVSAYWNFDDGAGALAVDRGGTNNGQIAGAAWTAGMAGSALRFDGVDDYITFPADPSLDAATGLTVAGWINGTYAANGYNTILSKGKSYYLGLYKGHLFAQITIAAGDVPQRPVMGATTLAANQWHHIALVYDSAEPSVEADLNTYTGLRPHPQNPVVPPGNQSEWDENIREIGNVLHEPDDPVPARRYKLFYSGYRGRYAENNVYVGYAYSPDGINWTKFGPIHERPLEDPYVVKHDGTYYLYAEDKFDVPFRNIRRLHSTDCETWTDDGDVFDARYGGIPLNWESADVSSPIVWIEGGTWYLLYEGRGFSGEIGLAASSNGLDWLRDSPSPVFMHGPPGSWDETTVVPDDLLKVGDTYYLFYHGFGRSQSSGFWSGMATSTDLHNWTRYRFNPMSTSETVMILRANDSYIFYVVEYNAGTNGRIGRYSPFVISAPHLYVNGVEDSYWQRTDTENFPPATDTLPLMIGKAAVDSARVFNGTLDEVRMNRRALGPGELRDPAYELLPASGGAVGCKAGSNPTFVGCALIHNRAAADGGGFFAIDGSRPTLINCTIAANDAAAGTGGGLFVPDGATLVNSIVWTNDSASGVEEIVGTANASYCDIEGGWPGFGNIGLDPKFASPATDDFRLRADSPCIDGGDLSIYTTSSLSDLSGHDRTMSGSIDIGAYEFGAGNFNCDRSVDSVDFGALAACLTDPGGGPVTSQCKIADFDNDGDVDLEDIASFQNTFFPGTP
ncbi:MAG: LamG-like jellyroll fold domain-containing protein [Phycisphaerales bacterium]|nr:LamG-like jellyroll fold domain-containing protein [Phycisphaerales bacterium]